VIAERGRRPAARLVWSVATGIAAFVLLAGPLPVSAACSSSFVDSLNGADRVFEFTVVGTASHGILPLRIDEIWRGPVLEPNGSIAVDYCINNRCTTDAVRSLRPGVPYLFSAHGRAGCLGAVPLTAELIARRPASARPPATVDAGLDASILVTLAVAAIAGAGILVMITARLTDHGLRFPPRG